LFGAQFTSFNGLLQVQNVPNNRPVLIDKGNALPTPEVVTLVEFNQGLYEGMLVRVNNVGFVDANGTLTLSGSRTISDGSSTSTVRTESGAPFSNVIMPYGIGSIVGIASDFNGAQIIPMVAEDIFTNNPLGTINFLQAIANFGSVNNAAVSAEQTLTVSGTQAGATPMRDVVLTASANFQLSLTSGSGFAQTVTVPAANLGSPTTVYVRFAPTTGFNQAINGTISLRSLGSPSQSFAVAGTESGNAEADLLITENFAYNVGQLTSVAGGANVSGDKWVNFSGTTNPLQVVAGSLSYTGYTPNSGNSVRMIPGSAEDAYTQFAPRANGTVYIAFLLKVTSAANLAANTSTTGDHLAGFLPDNSTSSFSGRVSIKAGAAADTYNLGLRATSSNATTAFIGGDLAINDTKLIVICYQLVDGATNDVMKMWVNPATNLTTEPTSDTSQVGAAADLVNIARFYLRQGTNAVNADIDGIRVAKTWAALFE
jgi:hypothetical protein